jgi:antitoxin (DNA-binding transcriptional repressor) of toxin-antitoxin stability system
MCYRGSVSDTPDQVGDTPDDEREPLPVNAAQGGEGEGVEDTRPRGPGRPASRAESAERSSTRRRIGIRELRQHASIYVDLAEKGYTVDITNRGRLVAQLVPAFDPGSPLERLIAAGVVEPAEEPGGVGDIEPYPSPATRQPTASEVLGQARDDQAQAERVQAEQAQTEAERVQAERADTEERR